MRFGKWKKHIFPTPRRSEFSFLCPQNPMKLWTSCAMVTAPKRTQFLKSCENWTPPIVVSTMPSETNKIKLALFASGGGSNADAICSYFQSHPLIEVALIVSNKPGAGVHEVARNYEIPAITI